jgi:hypothetical protein
MRRLQGKIYLVIFVVIFFVFQEAEREVELEEATSFVNGFLHEIRVPIPNKTTESLHSPVTLHVHGLLNRPMT